MIDENALKTYCDWIKNNSWCWEFEEKTVSRFFEIVGDDRDGLERFLNKMKLENLTVIYGLFENIYEKWMDDKMWNFLSGLEKNSKRQGIARFEYIQSACYKIYRLLII